MNDTITVSGVVGTIPRHVHTAEGYAIASFRLANTHRRFDRPTERWVDGDTSWFTVTAFRQMADNVGESISKGDRVLVTGRLKVTTWKAGEKSGTGVEIEASGIGHDLLWGRTTFVRTTPATAEAARSLHPFPDAGVEPAWHSPADIPAVGDAATPGSPPALVSAAATPGADVA